ncbi:MAG: hypothetical protein ACLQGP_02515 [Isosphaeraceae bacterium]
MRLSGHEINSQLRQKLAMPTGRHLYVVLGTYDRLEQYERLAFREARGPDDRPLGSVLNINLSLLQRFKDEELKWLVQNEASMPETVKKQLADELDALIAAKLEETSFLAIKNLELLFAYDMELNCFRIRATNQKHILVLLPGERIADRITLFHEAPATNHRTLPMNLVPENHLWELSE